MTELKTFIIRGEHREAISLLSQEQKGDLLDAMFSYNLDGEEVELEGMVKMAFAFIKNTFDSDRKKYEATCERNRNNGKKSPGRPRKDEDGEDPGDDNPDGFGNNPDNREGISETQATPENPMGNEETQDNPVGLLEIKNNPVEGKKGGIDSKNGNPNGKRDNPENPVGLSENQGNPRKPKKPYSYTNSYTNTNTNITPPISPPGEDGVVCDRNFAKEWETIRVHWNSLGLPTYKKLFVNLPNAGEVKNWMNAYSVEEIMAAITNYRKLLPRIPPTEKRYDTLFGFIRSGIDRFHDGAKPTERYEVPEEEKVSACAPDPLPEISEEEREEVHRMMLEDNGILGQIARRREKAHAGS